MNVSKRLKNFELYLNEAEKSRSTIEKYVRDVRAFFRFIDGKVLTKNAVIEYKKKITEEYAPASVNSMLASINCFLRFVDLPDHCVKQLKIQKQIFANEKKELTIEEYRRLLNASRGTRLELILQTICETGIRISELQYITVESLRQGKTVVDCKNKTRVIFIPTELRRRLFEYVRKNNVKSGSVFVTKSGKHLNRCNIWRDMKALCEKAKVSKEKVFPHNLRHLFARTFYSIEKDIVRLADLLGHSSINTTRIYMLETGSKHQSLLESLHRKLTT